MSLRPTSDFSLTEAARPRRGAVAKLILAAPLALALALGGCAHVAGDKCYVTPDRHEAARRLYERSGSLDLTRRTLQESGEWMDCEIEQTIDRLANENAAWGDEQLP
jgi:hypothetical protein